MTGHSRSIAIKVSQEQAGRFIADVSNLPSWVKFFRQMDGVPENNTAFFTTPLGRCRTTVANIGSGESVAFRIVSDFSGKIEHADIQIKPGDGELILTFFLFLPDTLHTCHVEQMLENLGKELADLKAIMEGTPR